MTPTFTYEAAFSRNIGWVTRAEQAALRGKRVAVAGVGGNGGAYLLTLARLGVGAFTIADFDTFDTPNFNRQVGASVSSLGRPKVEVMAQLTRDINPEADIRIFPAGVDKSNIGDFLEGVDCYLDGLDFFAFDARETVFPACAARGIPAVTALPLGMGTSVMSFLPGGMSFEEYFRWHGAGDDEKALKLLIGMAPAGLHGTYLVEPDVVDFFARKVPSIVMGCTLCAGLAATEVLKLLLGRGDVRTAPRGMHFDGYRNKFRKTWRPGGNANPLQRLALAVVKHRLEKIRRDREAAGTV